ncbi:hypothetical protein PR202_ga19560 [Eleusine coracana subsp. coracana]|uniref:Serpin domain-containing protein n=1 Tax=Eleusine coracana subsp. coracana TaxID=191504 RepID=A0AAV5CWP9_ELECO|nr:hypothetical protein PR202_ga19560 [Eleusine coracana subsp. coracana]
MRSWPQVAFAAGVFVDRSLHLTPEFASAAASDHAAVARSVDFRTRPAAAAAEVNAFIERATAGRIRNLLVSPDAAKVKGNGGKVVLANGMHFKATWARRFDPADTVRELFHLGDGYTSVRVPFLSDAGVQYAVTFVGFKMLQCFYKMTNREGRLDHRAPCFCMLVFLPHRRDGLPALLRLAVTEPDFVMRCVPRREQLVRLCMVPKFRFEFRFDARRALRELGLAAPFDPDAADLSGMVANAPPEGMYASAVRVACAVEVDEEGTTAVAFMHEPTSPGYSPCDASPAAAAADELRGGPPLHVRHRRVHSDNKFVATPLSRQIFHLSVSIYY